MSHGFSATYPMALLAYAKRLRAAGFAAFCYDHKNFGESDGLPRGEINGWIQARGYIDAIKYVNSLPQIDNAKLAVWGDSYSAMEAIIVAAIIPEIMAVIAQVPAFGWESPTFTPTSAMYDQLRDTLLNGDVTSVISKQVGPMPVVTFTQKAVASILPPLTAFRWFIEYGGRLGSGWVNEATWVEPKTPVELSAHIVAPFLAVPTLMTIAPEDEMPGALPSIAYEVLNLMKCEKHHVSVPGGHFELLWEPGDIFEYCVTSQINFLKNILKKMAKP